MAKLYLKNRSRTCPVTRMYIKYIDMFPIKPFVDLSDEDYYSLKIRTIKRNYLSPKI